MKRIKNGLKKLIDAIADIAGIEVSTIITLVATILILSIEVSIVVKIVLIAIWWILYIIVLSKI
jgi:hypothetical protein